MARAPLALLIVLLAAPGCREETVPAKAAEDVAPREVALRGPGKEKRVETPPFHLLKLELEEAGAAPHIELRYTGTGNFALRATTRARFTDNKKPITVETGLALTAREGRINATGLAASGDSHPVLAGYKQHVAGASAAFNITDRGTIAAVTGAASLTAKRELTAVLLRHLVALPNEPVGIGGRWRVKYAIARGGVYIAQTTTFELVAREGAKLSLKLTTRESAEPQPILSESQVVGELLALRSLATGTIEVDLDTRVARRGSLTSKSTFHARAGGEEIFRETETSLELGTSSAKKPAITPAPTSAPM